MDKIKVITGYGYFSEGNKIIAKAELSPGEHPIKHGYTYTEVSSAQDLKNVVVYEDKTEKQAMKREDMIQGRMRDIAIRELKQEGKIDG